MWSKLNDLKVGDPVVLLRKQEARRAKVSRVTPTLVVVAGQKFRKLDGRETPRSEWRFDESTVTLPNDPSAVARFERQKATNIRQYVVFTEGSS